MYSKDKGFTHAPVGESLTRHRPHRAPRVSVPPNYRGHAIVDGEERPLGTLDDTRHHTPAESLPAADTPVPRFDGLPRVSQLSDGRRGQQPAYIAVPTPYADDGEANANEYAAMATSPEGDDAAPPPSSTNSHPSPQNADQPRRSPQNATHLPHPPQNATQFHSSPPSAAPLPFRPQGILSLGLEELLLLGLILFLLREGGDCSDRGDLDETVILLGLLLLLG